MMACFVSNLTCPERFPEMHAYGVIVRQFEPRCRTHDLTGCGESIKLENAVLDNGTNVAAPVLPREGKIRQEVLSGG